MARAMIDALGMAPLVAGETRLLELDGNALLVGGAGAVATDVRGQRGEMA